MAKIIDLDAFVPEVTEVKLRGGRTVKLYSILDIPYQTYLKILAMGEKPEDAEDPVEIMASQLSLLMPELTGGAEEVKSTFSLRQMRELVTEAMRSVPLETGAPPAATEETTTEELKLQN